MKILILGANGFIGKYYKKFTKLDKLFLTSSKKKNNYIHYNLIDHDIEKVLSKYKITHVVFFAAISKPEDCQKDIKLSQLINVIKTKKVINQLIKKNIYFIFLSSDYIFNGKKGNYLEGSKPDPMVLYGKQKLNIENFLKKNKNKNFSIMRCPKTYGDEINDKSIFTSFLRECLKNKKKFVIANDQIFTALYVKDLIKVIDIFLNKKITGKFNVCGDESFSRFSYFNKIIRYFKFDNIEMTGKQLKYLSDVKNIPLNVSMNNIKLKKKINYKFTKFSHYLNIIFKKYPKNMQKNSKNTKKTNFLKLKKN
jgi:dTDP-4-dehydrorhamnose reductase|tara:strand:+ start:852 stop:1778 length:927 start_codon:yes stop_codon:yes gene_type:complete